MSQSQPQQHDHDQQQQQQQQQLQQQLQPPTSQQSIGSRAASPLPLPLPLPVLVHPTRRPQSEPSLGYTNSALDIMDNLNDDTGDTGAANNAENTNAIINVNTNVNAQQQAPQQAPLQQPLEDYYDPSGYRALEDDNNNQNHQQQNHQSFADTATTTTNNNNDTPVRDDDKTPSSTLLHHHSNSSSTNTSSKSSRAARWFALETTPEDRLSYHIIKTEIKTVLRELLHFFKHRNWKKKLLTVACIIMASLVFFDLFFLGNIKHYIGYFLIWMTEHPYQAEFAFILIFVLATLLFVPPTVLLIGAGWAFADACGVWVGILAAVVSCFMGSVIGSLLSFVRARYMMRDLIELFIQRYPIVRAADQALKRDGFRIMFLLRLCPLIPYHGLNYLGGISGVSCETFVFSLVGMLPYQIMVIIMGASAGTLHNREAQVEQVETESEQTVPEGTNDQQQMGMIIVMSAGVAFFVIAMILAARFTEKELQKELNIGEADMESYITHVRRMSLIDLYDDQEEQQNCEYELEIQHDNSMFRPHSATNNSSLHKEDVDAGINRYVFNPTLVPT